MHLNIPNIFPIARLNRLTFKKAYLRFLAQFISIIPLGFGIWSIATDKKKQAWHDMLLNCYVIKNQKEINEINEIKEIKQIKY